MNNTKEEFVEDTDKSSKNLFISVNESLVLYGQRKTTERAAEERLKSIDKDDLPRPRKVIFSSSWYKDGDDRLGDCVKKLIKKLGL